MTFRPTRWTRRVESWVRRVDGMDRAALAWHRRRVELGNVWLWGGFVGRRMVMVMLMEAEEGPYGTELNCELAAGDLPHGDLTRAAAAAGEHVARQGGCVATRFSTLRPGLARKTVLLGYELVEVRMRKVLS